MPAPPRHPQRTGTPIFWLGLRSHPGQACRGPQPFPAPNTEFSGWSPGGASPGQSSCTVAGDQPTAETRGGCGGPRELPLWGQPTETSERPDRTQPTHPTPAGPRLPGPAKEAGAPAPGPVLPVAQATGQPETGCVLRSLCATCSQSCWGTDSRAEPQEDTRPQRSPSSRPGRPAPDRVRQDPAQSTSVPHHWRAPLSTAIRPTIAVRGSNNAGRGKPRQRGDGEDDTVPRPPQGSELGTVALGGPPLINQATGQHLRNLPQVLVGPPEWPEPQCPLHRKGRLQDGGHVPGSPGGRTGPGSLPLGPSVPVLLADPLAFDPVLAGRGRPGPQAPSPTSPRPRPLLQGGSHPGSKLQGQAGPRPTLEGRAARGRGARSVGGLCGHSCRCEQTVRVCRWACRL